MEGLLSTGPTPSSFKQEPPKLPSSSGLWTVPSSCRKKKRKIICINICGAYKSSWTFFFLASARMRCITRNHLCLSDSFPFPSCLNNWMCTLWKSQAKQRLFMFCHTQRTLLQCRVGTGLYRKLLIKVLVLNGFKCTCNLNLVITPQLPVKRASHGRYQPK